MSSWNDGLFIHMSSVHRELVPNIKKPTEQQKTTGKEENEVQAIKATWIACL